MGRTNRMQNRTQNRAQNRIGKTTKMLSEHHTVHRGDVFFAELGYHGGRSIQDGCRPVLVVSNDKGNYHSNTISIIPLTGCFKRPDLPYHILLYPEDIKNRHQRLSVSTILTEQVTTISKSDLRGYVGRIEDSTLLGKIEYALSIHLGLCG